jgi:mono/diheme cytochrome c family protein
MTMSRTLSLLIGAALTASLVAPAVSAQDAKIARTWKAKCASCHGADGKGDTDQGKTSGIEDYTKPDWQKAHDDGVIKKAITEGVNREKNGKKQEMDAYKEKLTPEQIDGLVQYVRSLK